MGARKLIKIPSRSSELAELIGVILGDGTMSRYQLAIYFNMRSERQLALDVRRDIFELFGIQSALSVIPRNALAIVASSRSLVGQLEEFGLQIGDKAKNESTVPPWVFEKEDLKKACLRGLMDTDGSIFVHRHVVGGRSYSHLELSFTGYSLALLSAVQRLFEELGLRSRIDPKYGHVFLHRADEVNRYMIEIGSRNPHHLQKFSSFHSRSQALRRGVRVAESTRLEIA